MGAIEFASDASCAICGGDPKTVIHQQRGAYLPNDLHFCEAHSEIAVRLWTWGHDTAKGTR